MKKKVFMMLPCIAAIAIAIVVGKKTYGLHAYETNSLLLENVEALSQNDDSEPAWWDFFNNYYVEERIPINTTTCHNGSVSYKGISFSVGSCTQYTYAVYWHCYDGGNKDLCTSSGVHTYI